MCLLFQGMTGFSNPQETKYSAEQGFHGGVQGPPAGPPPPPPPPASHTPPVSAAYHSSGAEFINRYKLEQTIRQLHGIQSAADPRSSFGTSFSGV